jgi:DNA-binding NarL/FixJ family response regulator
MTDSAIRIFIVDDHAVVRTGISTWIMSKPGLQLVGEAANGEEAVRLVMQSKPDVVLMDLVMPVLDGVAATRQIVERNPEIKILVVTSFSDQARAVEAVRAGAIGFILKDASPQEMLEAISSVAKGRPWLSTELARSLFLLPSAPQQAEAPPELNVLTARELEVLRWVAHGFPDQEIAERLVVTKSTVRYHLGNILGKLNLENRTQAALLAIRSGLLKSAQG